MQELIQKFFQFLTQRDLENLVSLFSENVDWYIPGNEERVKWLGKRRNRQDVKEFYQLLWGSTEPVSANIDKIFVDGKDVVISGEFSTLMLQTNKVVESLFFIQMQVEDGFITKYKLLEDSYAVSKALTVE